MKYLMRSPSQGWWFCRMRERRRRMGSPIALKSFCFYTRQDLNRAKRTSQLSLAFWGAPDGASESMLRVGQCVVDAFRKNGFIGDWSESPSLRLTVYLWK